MKKVSERLTRLENAKSNRTVPDIILISYEGSWCIVKEQYSKHDAKGNVISGSGTERVIKVRNREDYEVPKDFKGVMIIDDIR